MRWRSHSPLSLCLDWGGEAEGSDQSGIDPTYAGRVCAHCAWRRRGAENVQRDLRDWLSDMELVPAGAPALL
jgi:hypothetical protein